MTAAGIDAAIQRTILAVWRIEQPRLLTSLARMLRDVPLAEDLTQEALLAALEHWPVSGVPETPGAWLMATAKRKALDHLRRRRMLARKHGMVALDIEQEQQAMPDFDSALDDDIGDEMLRLIFTACHPLLSRQARGEQARTGPAAAARRRGRRCRDVNLIRCAGSLLSRKLDGGGRVARQPLATAKQSDDRLDVVQESPEPRRVRWSYR
jgi:DNA-directed RNA polymerase specialized sigma24 family protein